MNMFLLMKTHTMKRNRNRNDERYYRDNDYRDYDYDRDYNVNTSMHDHDAERDYHYNMHGPKSLYGDTRSMFGISNGNDDTYRMPAGSRVNRHWGDDREGYRNDRRMSNRSSEGDNYQGYYRNEDWERQSRSREFGDYRNEPPRETYMYNGPPDYYGDDRSFVNPRDMRDEYDRDPRRGDRYYGGHRDGRNPHHR